MNLRSDIQNNWHTDIIGQAHKIRPLWELGYPSWTVKYRESYGVAIPYDGEEEINEFFSSAQIKSDVIIVEEGNTKRAIILIAANSVSRDSFAALCEELLSPGANGEKRKRILDSPVAWWQEWKELLGNRDIDERVYDLLGELCALRFLVSCGKDVTWEGPNYATYDIEIEGGFVEVKSTLSRAHKEITISNLFQLDPPGKTLNLFFCQFERTDQNGFSIDSIVDELVSLGLNRDYLNMRLSRQGLVMGMSARRQLFILHDMLNYKIDENFPRITPSSFVGGVLPTGITKIDYTIDLDGIPAQSLIQGENHEI